MTALACRGASRGVRGERHEHAGACTGGQKARCRYVTSRMAKLALKQHESNGRHALRACSDPSLASASPCMGSGLWGGGVPASASRSACTASST